MIGLIIKKIDAVPRLHVTDASINAGTRRVLPDGARQPKENLLKCKVSYITAVLPSLVQ